MLTTRSFLFGLAALLLVAPVAHADDVIEPSTGHGFAARRDNYVLTGVGVRKRFIIKVYAMAFYVDEAGAKKAFASGAGDPHEFLIDGAFAKMGVLHFVRDVDHEKIQEAYRESLAAALAGPDKGDAEAFINMFTHDMKEGQEQVIKTSADGQIEAVVAGEKKMGPKNPSLCKAIWSIWLGKKPISSDLKNGLVGRLREVLK